MVKKRGNSKGSVYSFMRRVFKKLTTQLGSFVSPLISRMNAVHRHLLKRSSRYRSIALYFRVHNNRQLGVRAGALLLAIIFVFGFLIRPVSALSTWTQSDWSGGIGSSTDNQYASATNIDTSAAGQISLSSSDNLFVNSTFDVSADNWNGANNSHDSITTYSAGGSVRIQSPTNSTPPLNTPASVSLPSTATNQQQMDKADFNNDGLDDLVVASGNTSGIAIYLADGRGGWQPASVYSGIDLYNLTDVVTGDFDNDGAVDIAATYTNTGNFSVFVNNGDGTSFTHTTYSGPTTRVCAVAKGDFNNDTYLDLVMTCYVWGSFTVFINDGSGGFPTKVNYSSGVANLSHAQYDLTVLDINGDGFDDIATPTAGNCAIRILKNNAGAGFFDFVDYVQDNCSGNSRGGYTLGAGDLNGDQYDDIVFGYRTGSTAVGGDMRLLSVAFGNSDGMPTSQANYPALNGVSSADSDVEVADINMDGFDDVIVLGTTDNQYSYYANNGDGTLSAKVDTPTGTFPIDASIGDFDGDDKPDVHVINRTSGTLVSSSNKTGGTVLSQMVNTADADVHVLEALVYTNGDIVTAADATLYANSNALATTYTSAGSGWYRLSATIAGFGELRSYGIQAAFGRTVYVDDMALYKFNSPGVLTSNIFDLGYGGDWGALTYDSIGSGVDVKLRTSNSPTMSGAPDWVSCPALSSGVDLTGQTCVTNNEQYVQYQITLTAVAGISPVFEEISIEYGAWDTDAPDVNATGIQMAVSQGGASIASNDWTNASSPYFNWIAGSDNSGGSGVKGYCLYLGTDDTADPRTTKGILDASPLSTPTCPFAVSSESINLATAGFLASPLATSNNPYYLSVKVLDNADNIFGGSSEQFQFRFDNTAPNNPAFINAPSNFISTKEATMNWETSGGDAANDANSGVAGLQYRIGGGGTWYGDSHTGDENSDDLLTNDGSYTTLSTPDYADLVDGNNVVYFRTWDNAGNISIATVTTVLKINTSGAPSTPQNVTATPATNTLNSFTFSWIEPTTFVGQAGNLTYCYTINTQPTEQTCTFTSAGQTSLSAGAYATQPGTNTMYVVAKDESGRINYASAGSVEFTANTSAPGMPLNIDIADTSVKSSSNWRLVISWEEPTNTGAGVSKYNVYRSTNNTSFTLAGSTSGTSYVDTGLQSQLYYYKVKACDSANNCGADSDTESKTPTGRFTTPAELTSTPRVSGIGTRTATISWSTDRDSDSKIAFGTSSGNYQPTESYNSTQTTDHTIALTSLTPGTTYYYQARWTDEDGNTGSSTELAFETLPPPSVLDVSVSNIGLTSAILDYTTSGAAEIKIYYGKTSEFGGIIRLNSSTAKSSYSSPLTELDDGTKYFFRVNTVDAAGNEYPGTTLSFSTPQAPRISNLRFQPIENEPSSSQKVTWTTNVPASSELSYGVTDLSKTTVVDKLVTEHEVVIRGLQDNSQYRLVARSRDANSNLAVSDQQLFRTALDTRPPQISDVIVDSTIRGTGAEARGQIVVSWRTDEPATSQVAYGEGSGAFLSSVSAEDTRLTYEHVVVISDLDTSRIYNVEPRSFDSARNPSESEAQTVIISRATDNVLAIIFNALQQLFGINQ